MDEQQAVEFLSSKGYNCLRKQSPSSSIGVSARQSLFTRKQLNERMPTEQLMKDPAYIDKIQQNLGFKNGGKKRSCKKRGGKKRSCKKRGGKKCSCKKRN